MNYEPNTQTLANTLATQIYEDIVASKLSEGDVFMTGDQVEKHYKISRSIAREALSQLRSLGVLQSRQRKGLIVSRPDPVHLMSRWVPLYCRAGNKDEFNQLAQLRFVLELGAIELAVTNATPEQLTQLASIACEFEAIASAQGHSPEADTVDLSFHSLILEMTHNPLISGMHRVISDYFLGSTQVAPMPSEDPLKAIREHYMITEALTQGNQDLARSLLHNHLEKTI